MQGRRTGSDPVATAVIGNGRKACMDHSRGTQTRPDALRRLRRFSDLDETTLRELSAICRLRTYAAEEVVAQEGDGCGYIGCVNDGFLRMQKTLADGRQQIVGLLVEGDMFGQAFATPQNFSIEAATGTEVWAFQRADFEALMLRAPDLERAVLLNILNELDRARDWMVIVSGQRVTGKLAGFLLVMCSTFAEIDHILQRSSDGVALEINIPISRTDLAHLLGSRPESISRAFHALQEDGDIVILRPDRIRVRDLEGLADKSGDPDLLFNTNLRNLVHLAARRG
jgi:CRP/FNR family transcriptional regulator